MDFPTVRRNSRTVEKTPSAGLVPIPGTNRIIWPGAAPAAEVSDGDVLLTAWLRPQPGGEIDVDRARSLATAPIAQRAYADRAVLKQQTAADPKDVEAFQRYCAVHHIDVVETHWRSVVISAPIARLIEAFGAVAGIYELADKQRFRHRSGPLHAPPEIAEILRGPFGIHQWPRSRAIGAIARTATPSPADDIIKPYAFPSTDGSGQTIGVLQLRGTFRPDDFVKSARAAGRVVRDPVVARIDNAELTHEEETAKDLESALDSQIIAALAPGSQIIIYAAPDDERGVLDAVRTAVFDVENQPSVLSISFGYPEPLWTPVALTILDELFAAAALIGVSIFCASGDNGAELSYDGKPHVLAPASSAFVHACGGTEILPSGSETAWSQSGGGFSERYAVPSWQSTVSSVAASYGLNPGRGLPDVAGPAMPGYGVFSEGTEITMGGTSAVAPMWSALAARLNQGFGKPIGLFAPLLYGAPAGALRDIATGGNDRFHAAAGWDPCTGLGVPAGDAIEQWLRGA
jgi:kumamolisin